MGKNHKFIVRIKGEKRSVVWDKLLPFIESIGKKEQYVTFTRMINETGELDLGEFNVEMADYIKSKRRPRKPKV